MEEPPSPPASGRLGGTIDQDGKSNVWAVEPGMKVEQADKGIMAYAPVVALLAPACEGFRQSRCGRRDVRARARRTDLRVNCVRVVPGDVAVRAPSARAAIHVAAALGRGERALSFSRYQQYETVQNGVNLYE